MYFRFGAALILAVTVSVVGVGVEKSTLSIRREISRQHYRLDVLRERQARARLRTQELGAPGRLIESIEAGRLPLKRPQQHDAKSRRRPLLRWQGPRCITD